MSQQPTYLLAPNFRFKPGSGPIALGNLIADPLRPHRALTTVDADVLKATYPRVETFSELKRSISRGTSRSVSGALWAHFMETVSTKVSGERGVSLHTSYTMDALETSYFVQDPPLEELEARLKVPRVQAVLKSGRIPSLRQPVYMVTGQMVAKGFAAQQDRAKNLSGEVEASASVPTPGGEVGLGASIGASSSMEDSDSWKTSEDIVFAYQLLRIELKGWKGTRIEYDEFRHKAAYLGKEDSEDDGDDDGQGDDDEDTVQVVAIRADVDNMPISRHAGKVETVELGEGETKITCISTIDT